MKGLITLKSAAVQALLAFWVPPAAPEAAQATAPFLIGVYAGTLPCADCTGIDTRLTLYATSPQRTGDGTFELSETYLGTRDGDRRFDARGRWTILRGNPTDADATVYQLNFDNAIRTLYFLRIGDQALRLLDAEQREIRSTANHMLARVTETPPGGYRSIDSADPDARAAAKYAVSTQASRTGTAVTLRRVARAERQIVAGLNYRLCLEVRVGGKPDVVQAIVFRDLQQRFSLTEWSPGGCIIPLKRTGPIGRP
jgi:uncharacterized lipoprotein NlpE involved in copper resistance